MLHHQTSNQSPFIHHEGISAIATLRFSGPVYLTTFKRIRNNSGSHQDKNWDFRFGSSNCNSSIGRTTPLCKGFSRYWSTVFQAAPEGAGFASDGYATPGDALLRTGPQTLLPPPQRRHRNLLRSVLALSRWRRQRRELPQHAGIEFPVHPHMLRHATGYYLANAGQDTRAIQLYLGHKNIRHTVRYTELSPQRFK